MGARFWTNPVGVAGLLMVGVWVVAGVFAPLLAPYDPLQSFTPLVLPGGVGADGHRYWLGTDLLGRDILSRLIWGTRTAILWATVATGTAFIVGITMGLLAGFYRGRVDGILSFFANALLSFPVLVLYIIIIVALGASGTNIVIAVTFASAPAIFRIVRALTIDIASRDFVKAAITQGEGHLRIMASEILPNAMGPLTVDLCLRLGYTVATIGVLGFLGLGLPPPTPDWGGMVNDGKAMAIVFPHVVILPLYRDFHLDPGPQPARRRHAGSGEGRRAAMSQPILRVRDLSVLLPRGADRRFAVEGVSLEIARAEILCVVGESGSGKSVLSAAVMGDVSRGLTLAPGSTIELAGEDIGTASPARLRHLRGSKVAMIFQEPMASLNPGMVVGRQVEEVLELHAHR